MPSLLFLGAGAAGAQSTWNLATGATWNAAANWTPAAVPSATGADVVFNGAATASNPAQTANRTIPLDGARTVGSIVFNNDQSTFTNTLSAGTGGSLTFDATDGGPALISSPAVASGTGNSTISAGMVLTDSVVANVANISATSGAGALNLTGAISGPGGFTKRGDGMATFGTGAKTYTGATVIEGGRMRISASASPGSTSGLTISPGGQLTLITDGTYTFGPGSMSIGGTGAVTGPYAAFPGAIRADTSVAATIANAITLLVDTLLHVQGSATGALILSNVVSGAGQLALTAPGSSNNLGTLSLGGANTYSGGTLVRGGTVTLTTSSSTFGSGEVSVLSGNAMAAGAVARIDIPAGILNAINDVATLSLAGGNVAGVADDGYVNLGAGVNETVGGLVLGGVAQAPGTYGSTSSGATFKNDEYFSGSGMLTVVPEPAAASLSMLGLAAFLRRRRSR